LSVSFQTNRTICPFCEETIVPLPSFPTLAAEFLTSLGSREKLTVGFDILEIDNNILVPTPDGEFLLIGNGSGSSNPIILPKRTRFTAKGDYEHYAEMYDCQEPGVGNVRILSPAVLEKVAGGWFLKERGRLEIVTPSKTKEATQPAQRFPSSVADLLKSQKRTTVVRADFLNDILVSDPDDKGEFLLIRDSTTPNQGQTWFLVPRLTRWQTKQEFYAYYEKYYDCARPSAGDVWIVDPAIVTQVEGGWKLVKKGMLEIENGGKEVEQKQKVKSSPVIPQATAEKEAPSVSNVRVRDAPVKNVSASRSIPSRFLIALVILGGLIGTIVVVWRLMSSTVKPSPNANQANLNTPTPTMVPIPGGEFTMGSDSGDEYERPAHKVTVKPFLIDINEVTCQEYEAFIKATGHKPPQGWVNGTYPHGGAHWPVTGVDWYDATAYAQWVKKRLPTEEEWEFAARGTDGRKYPWGSEWRANAANAGDTSAGQFVDVGNYPDGKSPFGARDMVGNAWEWTLTDLKSYPGGQLPTHPPGESKIIRGGSWKEDRNQATVTYRGYLLSRGAKDYGATGFRCVADIESRPSEKQP
jgi:formylglycine-generating enzyme required for sulfatase activity